MIAIVTAFWDARGRAADMIESVLGQVAPIWRWYVAVDGKAPDRDGAELLAARAQGEGRIRYRITDTPIGAIGAAKGAAMAMAMRDGECDWAIELDADDELLPEAVELVHVASSRTDAPAIGARHLECRPWRRAVGVQPAIPYTAEAIERHPWGVIALRAYRLAAVEAVGGYDAELRLFEDWHLHVRLARRFGPFCRLPMKLYRKWIDGRRRPPLEVKRQLALARRKLGIATEPIGRRDAENAERG